MNTFEELCKLEESARQAGIDLGKARDLVRQCSRRILDARNTVPGIEANLERLQMQLRTLKTEAPVVLLSEYEQYAFQREQVEDLLATKRQEILKLEKQIQVTSASIPDLERNLKQIEAQLSSFSLVIPFR